MFSCWKTAFNRISVKNFYTRTITGIFFVAIIIGSMLLHPVSFASVIYILMLGGMIEYYRMVNTGHIHPQKALGLIAGSVVYLVPVVAAQGLISPKYLAILPALIFVFFFAEIFRNTSNPAHNIAFGLLPVAWISIPMAALALLLSPLAAGDPPLWKMALGLFAILWSYDTFAYLTGMLFGKHKLIERISPKKTWEGAIGGTVFSLAAAFVLSVFFKELSLVQWMLGALIIVITGTFGDLAESMLKRKFDLKDSGGFFPGHGGILDRFDSVFFAAPAFFCYLILLNL